MLCKVTEYPSGWSINLGQPKGWLERAVCGRGVLHQVPLGFRLEFGGQEIQHLEGILGRDALFPLAF
jgi:hypothetical protein